MNKFLFRPSRKGLPLSKVAHTTGKKIFRVIHKMGPGDSNLNKVEIDFYLSLFCLLFEKES